MAATNVIMAKHDVVLLVALVSALLLSILSPAFYISVTREFGKGSECFHVTEQLKVIKNSVKNFRLVLVRANKLLVISGYLKDELVLKGIIS